MVMRSLVFILAFWMELSVVTPGTGAAAPTTTLVDTAAKGAKVTTVSESDAARYARREQSARELEKFRGGEGVSIYIGGSVVAVALVVIIALLIL